MAFQQLYYTSCEHGLSGFSGYQFNAVSPDASAETMRLVESLTAYEPPRSLLNSQTPQELARCPVNLLHVPGHPCVSAQVRYVGRDPSQRFGNYFAHALSTQDFGQDGAGVLGIELWGSPVWRSTPAPSTTLPELPAVEAGPLRRDAVGRFLRDHPHRDLIGPLLTATLDALAHQRTVLLVEQDSERVARWIAAACYLLPPPLARRLSFATYLHRPDRGRTHLVGTVPEIRIDLGPEQQDAFHVLDLVEGRAPELPANPLAQLLARIGPAASDRFWERAETYLWGDEQDAEDWHGPAAAAAARGGAPLTEPDIAAVLDWLRRAPDPQSPVSRATLQDLHRQQRLGRGQLTELRRMAEAAGLPDLVQRATDEVVERDLRLILDGDSRALDPVRIDDPRQRAQCTARWLTFFQEARGASALRLLAWADGSGLEAPDHELRVQGERIGEHLLATAVTVGSLDALGEPLTEAARRWPAFRQGLVAAVLGLEHGRPGQFRSVLRALPPGLLTGDDLINRPDLLEDFLLVRAEHQPGQASRTLLEILRLRRDGLVDVALLQALWPGHGNRWSHAEALSLIPRLAPDLRWDDGARRWLAATVLQDAPGALELSNFLQLAERLEAPPRSDWLPADARMCVRYALNVRKLLGTARTAEELAELLNREPPGDWPPVRALLRQKLPQALTDRVVRDPARTGPRLGGLEERTALDYLTLLHEQTCKVGRGTRASEPLISHLAAITRAKLTEEPRALVQKILRRAEDRWPTDDLARLVAAVGPVHRGWAEHLGRALDDRPEPLRRRIAGWLPGGRSRTGAPAPQNPEE
ncbi:GTPase-associated protein 1-related protein [Streptomyces sp. FH025]|uniref:GTPase-associated protein 1-related protein n=1 Tax=Streptomyces sp. FH025 TaxID=2815937 RepID=UPI001A9E0385|nr:GTPase-associated protein 1-related protein [Streptomyces sp. FH025]MBO1419067.1 hypothetical protein [Streptomyces sp. FH025]